MMRSLGGSLGHSRSWRTTTRPCGSTNPGVRARPIRKRSPSFARGPTLTMHLLKRATRPAAMQTRKNLPMTRVEDLQPVEFNVVIELDPTEEKTAGGIILTNDKLDRNRLEETAGT